MIVRICKSKSSVSLVSGGGRQKPLSEVIDVQKRDLNDELILPILLRTVL